MINYDGKFGTIEESNSRDELENLFINTDDPKINDTDDTLEMPQLSINMDELDKKTENRAKVIVEKLSDYYFDEKYIREHPYIPNKIAQEVDNIRRLLKMLAVNEKAQDTLILSITMNAGKGTLYSSLTALQNSMLQMQSQLNQLTSNLESIFTEMQENCEKTFEEKDKETISDDGSIAIRGSRDFIKQINAMIDGDSSSNVKNENLSELENQEINKIL